jgi:PKD domain-containing protein/uncharacterized protein DUF1566
MKKITHLIVTVTMLLFSLTIAAQIAINADGSPADSSSILDLQSTTKGFLMPEMTNGEMLAIPIPAKGLMVFNSTFNKVVFYNGTNWIFFDMPTCAPATPNTISGDSYICGGDVVTYSISAVPGATLYNWTVPVGATISNGQGTTNITVNFGTTSGNVSVRAENNCGISSYQDLAVVIDNGPPQPGDISGNTVVSNNTTGETYSITAVSGATNYNWTVPAGASITSGQGTPSITVNFGTANGNVSVRSENGCDNSSYTDLAILVGGEVGDFYGGGVVFYLDGSGGGLICAINDLSYNGDYLLEWGCFGNAISGADGTAIGTGAQNTIDIEIGCSTANTAADICANLSSNGYSDWFLPSKDELDEMFLNKAAINATATVNGGSSFVNNRYWSSSENNNNTAWLEYMGDGGQASYYKTDNYRVRAARAF